MGSRRYCFLSRQKQEEDIGPRRRLGQLLAVRAVRAVQPDGRGVVARNKENPNAAPEGLRVRPQRGQPQIAPALELGQVGLGDTHSTGDLDLGQPLPSPEGRRFRLPRQRAVLGARPATVDPRPPERGGPVHRVSVYQAQHLAGELTHRIPENRPGDRPPLVEIASLQNVDDGSQRLRLLPECRTQPPGGDGSQRILREPIEDFDGDPAASVDDSLPVVPPMFKSSIGNKIYFRQVVGTGLRQLPGDLGGDTAATWTELIGVVLVHLQDHANRIRIAKSVSKGGEIEIVAGRIAHQAEPRLDAGGLGQGRYSQGAFPDRNLFDLQRQSADEVPNPRFHTRRDVRGSAPAAGLAR